MASITIEQLDDITVFHASGKVSLNEIIDIIKNNYHTVKRHILWDLTRIDLSEITSAHFKIILEAAKEHRPYCVGGKTAYYTTSAGDYGVTRMFSTLAEIANMPYPYMAFRSFNEAVSWLKHPCS